MAIYRKTFVFIALMAFMISGVVVAAKLEYVVIEDVYDDTTQIRTVTEQAPLANEDVWLIRTIRYSPYNLVMNVTHIPAKTTKDGMFTPIILSTFDAVPDPISAPSSMKLEYVVIEDVYDDTTKIRTVTEQAQVYDLGLLIRTTLYTPHNIAMDVNYTPAKIK